MPNYSKKPLLTANDEEYAMLTEVIVEFEKQKIDKTARETYGTPTEIVMRNHLKRKNFNVSTLPDVTIQGSRIKNNLLAFKKRRGPKPE